MSSKGRVIVTGANGFIGSRLVRRLAEAGYEPIAWVRDSHRPPEGIRSENVNLSSREDIARAFAGAGADYFLHLAARAIPNRRLEETLQFHQDSVLPTVNLALEIPKSLRLAAFFGSCEEYGDGPAPFRENQKLEAFSPYGWSKISAHYAVQMIGRQRGIAWTWLRPFLTFGPGQPARALVPSLVSRLVRDESIALTPGEQTRDFIYIEDLCDRMLQILAKPDRANGQTFNLCSGVPRTVRSVAEAVHAAVGRGKLELGALPYREREAMSFYGCPEAFERAFGKASSTDFGEAIRQTVEWERKNR